MSDELSLEKLISQLENQADEYEKFDDITKMKNLKLYNQLVKDQITNTLRCPFFYAYQRRSVFTVTTLGGRSNIHARLIT